MPRNLFERLKLSRLVALVALGMLAVSPLTSMQAQAPIASRITQQVDDAAVVKLRGNTHPLARAEFDRGQANVSLPAGRLMLVLKRSAQQEADLQIYLSSLQDKASPNYHKFLTPEQFGKLYGVSDQDLLGVTTWLQSQGFTIADVSKARNIIEFSGSVAQVQSAFHTAIHSYLVKGEQHYANATDPSIPAALAPVVAGIAHLNNFKPKSNATTGPRGQYSPESHRFTPQLTGGKGTTASPYFLYVGASDAATIYNTPNSTLNKNFAGGTSYDGTGTTIGIAGDSNINVADFTAYRSFFGLPALSPTIIIDGGVDPLINGDEIEALLDTEVSGGIAPGANINLYIAADTTLESGLFLAIYRALNDNAINILNISFGACEASEGNSGNASIYNLAEQAAAQGISVTVSTGDSGSAGCDNPNTETSSKFGLAVNGLASTPYTVGVGGTDYNVLGTAANFATYANTANTAPSFGTALKYIPEEPWNDSPQTNAKLADNTPFTSNGATNISAAGGGQSNCISQTDDAQGNLLTCDGGYAKPSWQAGPGVPADKVRDIPDISFLASDGAYNATWAICTDGTDSTGTAFNDCQLTNGQIGSTTTVSGVGGTSAAAPAFAGMLALVNQKVAPGGRLGLVNPILYSLATSTPAVFHDVTTGNNSVVCTSGIGVDGANDCGKNGFLLGWDTNAGYDLATGLGSVDVTALANNWATAANSRTATTTTLTVNGSTTAVAVGHGTSLPVLIAVAPTSTGGVTLTASNNGSFDGGQVQDLAANSQASFKYNALPGGTYNLFANYTGDNAHAASKSQPVAVVITPETSTVSAVPTIYDAGTGSVASVAATAVPYGFFVVTDITPYGNNSPKNSSGNPVPDGVATGTIAMTDGGAVLFSGVKLSSLGYYEDQRTTLAVGSHTLNVAYSGDSSFLPGTGTSGSFTIVKGATTVALASNTASTTSAGSVTLTATVVTDSLGTNPSGTVTFFSGTKVIGSAVAVTGAVDSKTGLAGATATLTVVGSGLAEVAYPRTPWTLIGGGAAMACVLFFGIPARRRSWRGLFALIAFAVTVSAVVGCGGGGSSSGGGGGGTGTAYNVTANYSGDTNYAVPTAASNAVSVTVK